MASRPPVRIEATVHGMVQGVGFRISARRHAHALGLVGTVANHSDGSVRVVAEGEAAAVDRFVRWLQQGPSGSRVAGVEVKRSAPVGDHATFEIVAG